MALLVIIYILIFAIVALAGYAVMQIKLAGMNVKDFWSFIEANQILDKLYEFSQKYKTLNKQQQVVYLMEAEKVFTAFDKIPDIIWEDEFKKYDEVLKKYKEIKMERWISN
jgi:biopolymer transport protein ExbB/TolQ